MWFYGYFTNGYSVNSTEVSKKIHDNSDNSDVIVNIFIFLKEQHVETKKAVLLKILLKKVYSSLTQSLPQSLPRNFQWMEYETL